MVGAFCAAIQSPCRRSLVTVHPEVQWRCASFLTLFSSFVSCGIRAVLSSMGSVSFFLSSTAEGWSGRIVVGLWWLGAPDGRRWYVFVLSFGLSACLHCSIYVEVGSIRPIVYCTSYPTYMP